jgi:hypothetical protein
VINFDPAGNDPVEDQILTNRGGKIKVVRGSDGPIPLQPQLSAIRQLVRHFHLDPSGDRPVLTPPRRGMKGAEFSNQLTRNQSRQS